ncbi:DUF6090 family protein [Ichthyenterobacterium sp. W332]|uniref:DUF6090 family protein n=1 Tax=Microcosmobacter mediterraneus TaxID=3075607 RepID=A0ABU2YGQ5_9FLAO|nr:DUF6090 family protein [Ichthyenterobacterium sp. W332]MDT0557217.1 DUF6090 family protein [Ichthyenterobacterium sp. W332]
MENKTGKYFKYAIGEIVLVVIGILIALQINNWNENRKNEKEQYFILNKLQSDIATDIKNIAISQKGLQLKIKNYIYCLDVLGNKKTATKEEFIAKFSSILALTYFDHNKTTFNNLVSSGKLELITNKSLSNSIVNYYTFDYKGWDNAQREYTRNIIAPYLLKFDFVPDKQKSEVAQLSADKFNISEFYSADIESFAIPAKTLQDYKEDLFIINIIREKLYNFQGQLNNYQNLEKQMRSLDSLLEREKLNFRNKK